MSRRERVELPPVAERQLDLPHVIRRSVENASRRGGGACATCDGTREVRYPLGGDTAPCPFCGELADEGRP